MKVNPILGNRPSLKKFRNYYSLDYVLKYDKMR